MKKKPINIIAIVIIIVGLVGLGIVLLIRNGKITLPGTTPVISSSEFDDPLIAEKEVFYKGDSNAAKLQESLLEGNLYSAALEDGSYVTFQFRENNAFSGYTDKENDDLGEWFVEMDGADMKLVIKSQKARNVYTMGNNNNGDITLDNGENVLILIKEN